MAVLHETILLTFESTFQTAQHWANAEFVVVCVHALG